jgi:hypothetical protein
LATPAEPGEAFIREVDDELSRDRMRGFWARYGRFLLLGVGLLLFAAAGWLFWREQKAKAAAERSAALTQAVADMGAGKGTEAEARIAALTTAGEPGTRALARLADAAVWASKGDTKQAATRLDAVAADASLAQPFRDLALLRSVLLQFDTLPPATVIERLRPLARPGNAWFGSAAELTALAHLRANRPDLARPLLEALIKDEEAPPSIRGRAQQLLATLPAGPAGAPAAMAPGVAAKAAAAPAQPAPAQTAPAQPVPTAPSDASPAAGAAR